MTTEAGVPVLRSRRVTLRPGRPEDAHARLLLGRDPEIVRMYGGSRGDARPMTEYEAKSWVISLMNRAYAWIVEADRVIGHVRLDHVDFRDRRASLAIGLDDPERLGQGLGTESIRLVEEYAFNSLKLHRLSVRVVAYNRRAIHAYEKCGSTIEGREREAAFVDGEWHDDVIMGVLAGEFADRFETQ